MSMSVDVRRFLESPVREALTDTPAIVLQGARQVGKSTLARIVADPGSATFTTLDDPVTLAVAESDPSFFVEQGGDGMLVIDEAQRAPGLILPLKAAIDRDRRPGRYLLTGSADLLRTKGVGDSLAGRAETFELGPFSRGEIDRRRSPEDFVSWVLAGVEPREFDHLDPTDVVSGGYPEVQTRSPRRAVAWFNSYIERLSSHDARALHQGGYADHLRRLLTVIAASGQSELVRARYARELGVAENTADAYLRTARDMRLVTEIPSWGRNLRSRVTNRPKACLNDSGLAAVLAGFTAASAETVGGREYYGALIEQFVAVELQKQSGWSEHLFRLHHFRDTNGLEVDLVVELSDGRLIAIEVKATRDLRPNAWKPLEQFRERFADREIIGVCLYGGTRTATVNDWLHLIPITALWQHGD